MYDLISTTEIVSMQHLFLKFKTTVMNAHKNIVDFCDVIFILNMVFNQCALR